MSQSNKMFMRKSLSLACSCLEDKNRAPFGSIIVKNNQIAIKVESEFGKGSKFVLELPK